MEFTSDKVELSLEDGIAMVAFKADDNRYLILTRALKPDEQDKGLGLDQVHIELNDQRNSTYGGVATGALNTSYLEIFLNNRGSGNVGATRISVRFDLPAERFTQLREVVSKLFQGHQRFKIIA